MRGAVCEAARVVSTLAPPETYILVRLHLPAVELASFHKAHPVAGLHRRQGPQEQPGGVTGALS